ncbi:hypothetical protein RCH12_002962 [Cryobacterium sp. MP_3.1]|uniref:hypothetical protein n=1 Tax=Cryobacterium sp. MP_3.1 TaxID=3071711 RepID=UPI002DF8F9EB|nr:hypothetical protein [Cryobacterium sp. MP_3.1]
MAQFGAAKGIKERERSINFFEIVKYKSPTVNDRMDHIDWQGVLKLVQGVPLKERVFVGSKTLIGEALEVDGRLHLKLMLVRDEESWLEVYDEQQDSVENLNLGANGHLVETTIVAFLDFGNVIGLIQGSTTAPTPSALENWINGLELLGSGVIIDTQVMVAHEVLQRLRESSEASQITVKAHTNKADALEARGSHLSGLLRSVSADYGPMTVTIILQASKAKDQTEGRKAILKEAHTIAEASGAHEVAKAKAKLVYIAADDTSKTTEIDFAKQRITAKRSIPTTSEDGSPIRNESAVRAILDVAAKHDDELRKIAAQPS